jgi:RNA polymerase sigma-70 factor (ECF subfamily)
MNDKSAGLAVETAKDPHSLYVTKIETEQVREALQQLPEELREIIVLREFAELSYQEIAGLLQCPLGTVMSRLSRARVKLGTLLSPSQSISKNKVLSQGALSSQASAVGLCEIIGTINE